MDRIPVELACSIFRLAVLQDVENESVITVAEVSEGRQWPGIFDYEKGPWAISRVCRKWRTICMSFPSLWCRFILSADRIQPGRHGEQELRTWLSFSGTSSLSFLIKTDGICNNPHNLELFRILADHSDRWEAIEVINATAEFWTMMHRHDVKSRLQALRHVTILSEGSSRGYVSDDEPYSSDCYNVFMKAPRFHSLTNRDYFPVSHLEMPWSQLTAFDGSERTHYSDLFEVLHRSPNLVTSRVEVASYAAYSLDISVRNLFSQISLNRLRILRIHLTSSIYATAVWKDVHTLIGHLDMPSLETLSIRCDYPSVCPPYTELAAVLRSSGCKLRDLELSSTSARPSDIIDLLSATPSLQRLSMTIDASDGSRVTQHTVISHLNVHSSGADYDSALVPSLNTLEFSLPSPLAVIELDLPSLAAGIRSRWADPPNPGCSIRTLVISLDSGDEDVSSRMTVSLPEGLPPILEVLQDEGLDVVIQRIGPPGLYT
ncbi:hypothetical protein V5O48_008425 [Marasmius crinis-equi]|uniref:F-box domain-containing protein n=1 Tax=Marasmius crinis-equi TaxID=585013 RepID=A0ABR3FED8_9AGAR